MQDSRWPSECLTSGWSVCIVIVGICGFKRGVKRLGLNCKEANKRIAMGVQAVMRLAARDRISATGSDIVIECVLRSCVCFLLDFRAYNHGLKGPQKPKPYCDNQLLRSPPVFTVRSGTVWRQPSNYDRGPTA